MLQRALLPTAKAHVMGQLVHMVEQMLEWEPSFKDRLLVVVVPIAAETIHINAPDRTLRRGTASTVHPVPRPLRRGSIASTRTRRGGTASTL